MKQRTDKEIAIERADRDLRCRLRLANMVYWHKRHDTREVRDVRPSR